MWPRLAPRHETSPRQTQPVRHTTTPRQAQRVTRELTPRQDLAADANQARDWMVEETSSCHHRRIRGEPGRPHGVQTSSSWPRCHAMNLLETCPRAGHHRLCWAVEGTHLLACLGVGCSLLRATCCSHSCCRSTPPSRRKLPLLSSGGSVGGSRGAPKACSLYYVLPS